VIRSRQRAPDGGYGPAALVSSSNGNDAADSRVAVNAAGQAAATWRQQRRSDQGNLIWVGTNFL
jgi:hypothetical protein